MGESVEDDWWMGAVVAVTLGRVGSFALEGGMVGTDEEEEESFQKADGKVM